MKIPKSTSAKISIWAGGLLTLIIAIGLTSCASSDTSATQTAESQSLANENSTSQAERDFSTANTPFLAPTLPPASSPTPSPLPSATLPPGSEPRTRYINSPDGQINVRSGPNTTFDTLGQLDHRDRIVVIGEADGWYQIEYADSPDDTAWVFASLTSEDRPDAAAFGSGLPTASSNNNGSPPNSSPPCACSGPDLDCSAFSSQRDAQACHDYCVDQVGYDYHNLDNDDPDTRACESLP